jgi:16S rRNA processing protein RimM
LTKVNYETRDPIGEASAVNMKKKQQAPTKFSFPFGTVVGFLGLAGDVKVRPSTNNPELLADVSHVQAATDDKRIVILEVKNLRFEKGLIIVRFSNHADRTSVEYLEDAKLSADEAQLLPLEEEEYWVKDLVGMDVFTTTGDYVGKVSSIIDGAHDLIEITPEKGDDGKTILVPFVKDLVPTVDMRGKRIEVTAVPGLLEPQ